MSVAEIRGGVPLPYNGTAAASPAHTHHTWQVWTKYLIARNKGAVPVRMYFNAEDAEAAAGVGNSKYVLLPVAAADEPHGEWRGPVECRGVWLKGAGGAGTVEVVAFQRRG